MNRSSLSTALLLLVMLLAACTAPSATEPSAVEPTSAPPTPSRAAATPEPTASSAAESASPTAPADELLALAFTDVRSGENFTLGELASTSGPVLLETMAVWCTTCLSQQREVVQAHASGDFTSVSLDVDLSESPEQLAEFADREGFVWRFAMADEDLYRMLQDRFGVAVTNPPSTPLIVIERDGTVRPLEFGTGVRGAEELLAELGIG
jgi:thiol-disulfide isomerase/thioredoxin